MDPITILRRAIETKLSELRDEKVNDYNEGFAEGLDYVRDLIREEE